MRRNMQRRLGRTIEASSRRRMALEVLEPRMVLALDVPAFSSLPGANQTVYLDFNGHNTQGTSWNSSYGATTINSPAYSTDADTANFSASELTNIGNALKRVAEDFAAFNVNVTTVEPPIADLIKSGTGDTKWGLRVVVTKDVAFNCGCGGIAYIDSFNWNSDTPVFVFNTSEIGLGEAASHEVGHALGLSHDGTATASYYQGHGSGATSWAPIMGVGYYVKVSQWDKGQYFGSNNGGSGANYGKGPDDLNIITTYNGFTYKADDHGDTNLTATPLAVSGASLSGSGTIERNTDVDVFQFTTGAGNVTLSINPASWAPNLDIQAQLYDSAGALVASSNPPDALHASFTNLSLSAGQYFLRLDGVGVGNPTVSPPTGYTDYASLGQYSITGSIAAVAGDTLSIVATDASKSEGNGGTTSFTMTVNRLGDTSGTSIVSYSVSGAGATAEDFFAGSFPSGSLSFGAGVTSLPITILVQGDTVPESNEGFTVTLSGPSAGTSLGAASATGTILNDDAPPTPPTLSISATSASKAEGTGSTSTPFTFTISRSGSTLETASVKYSVTGTGGKAASSSDFEGGFPTNVTVNFAIGQLAADITVNVVADSKRESNETFKVTLSSATGASIGVGSANGTINNDDARRTSAARQAAAARRDEEKDQDAGDDEDLDPSLIAVADPMWMFVPPEMLTTEQLSVPVITWIDGVPFIGDLLHDHEHDHEHDHDDDHDHGRAVVGLVTDRNLGTSFGSTARDLASRSTTPATSILDEPSPTLLADPESFASIETDEDSLARNHIRRGQRGTNSELDADFFARAADEVLTAWSES